jgi:hypothetical protein
VSRAGLVRVLLMRDCRFGAECRSTWRAPVPARNGERAYQLGSARWGRLANPSSVGPQVVFDFVLRSTSARSSSGRSQRQMREAPEQKLSSCWWLLMLGG